MVIKTINEKTINEETIKKDTLSKVIAFNENAFSNKNNCCFEPTEVYSIWKYFKCIFLK